MVTACVAVCAWLVAGAALPVSTQEEEFPGAATPGETPAEMPPAAAAEDPAGMDPGPPRDPPLEEPALLDEETGAPEQGPPEPTTAAAPDDPRPSVANRAWRGLANGAAVALGLALPAALLGAGLAALTFVPSLLMAGTGWMLIPFVLGAMLLAAAGTGCCWGAGAFALIGAVPAGLVAGIVTMLGAASVSRRKLPWVPTLLATTVPRASGGLLGLVTGVAAVWGGALLLSCGSSALLAGRAIPVAWSILVLAGFYGAVALLVPSLVLLGTMLGDLLGLWIITGVINPLLARDVGPREDAIPTALFYERTQPEPLD